MKKILWTEEIHAALEALQKQNDLSYSEIARRMSDRFDLPFTRNSCIGRAHRVDLPRRKAVKPGEKKPMPIPVEKPTLAPALVEPTVHSRQLTIYQLRDGDCRWPSDEDRPPYTYCGQPCENGLSYCPEHADIVYHSPRQT